jgi:hypothetical protein
MAVTNGERGVVVVTGGEGRRVASWL